MNLVERLRGLNAEHPFSRDTGEAAEEIERLQAENKRLEYEVDKTNRSLEDMSMIQYQGFDAVINQLNSKLKQLAAHEATIKTMREALIDISNGWKYIRSTHGDLYGVGWDRAQDKADNALSLPAPTDHLMAYRSEVLEEAANSCDNLWYMGADFAANAIRDMKEKKNV